MTCSLLLKTKCCVTNKSIKENYQKIKKGYYSEKYVINSYLYYTPPPKAGECHILMSCSLLLKPKCCVTNETTNENYQKIKKGYYSEKYVINSYLYDTPPPKAGECHKLMTCSLLLKTKCCVTNETINENYQKNIKKGFYYSEKYVIICISDVVNHNLLCFGRFPHETERIIGGKVNIKKILAVVTVTVMCLLNCGCSFSASMENLLTPPKLTEEQEEIYRELISSVGRNIKLKYPRSGDYRSAFVLHNIDGEPGDEAMVFYESKDIRSGESALRLKFLDKSSGKWEAVYDLACPGNEIESVVFTDLSSENADSDAITNIILSYTLINQTDKAFSVLKYSDKKPTELLSSTYSCMEITDLNKDDRNELVIVSVNKELQTASASMYTDGGGERLELLSNTPLYGGAADYIRVTKGKLDENTPALFLDYSKGGSQSGTDVLYCYGSRLFCPDSIGGMAGSIISRQVNDYMAEIYSFDIDGDGFVEVPSTTPLPGYETLTKPEQLCAVLWYTVQNDNFTQKTYSYFSGKYRFALMFPNRWTGVVTAIADFNNNDIIFISYDARTGLEVTEKNYIMRIHSVDKDDSEAVEAAKGMKMIGESDETVYYAVSAGNLALTESELADCFVLL